MSDRTPRRPLSHSLLGGITALLALSCSANAVQTASTPNAAFITYSLEPSASTGNYKPASGVSTYILGTCTTGGKEGLGEVTLMSTPVSDPAGGQIEWIGRNSNSNSLDSAKATSGNSNGALNQPIVFIDFNASVFIETGTTKDTIRVHNTFPDATLSGNLTWIW